MEPNKNGAASLRKRWPSTQFTTVEVGLKHAAAFLYMHSGGDP